MTSPSQPENSAPSIREAVEARLARRYRSERRFRFFGVAAIGVALSMLALLVGSVLYQGLPAFTVYELELPVELDERRVDPQGDRSEESLRSGSYNSAIQQSLRDQFPHISSRSEMRELFGLYTALNAPRLMDTVIANPDLVGQTVPFRMPISDDVDLYLKGRLTTQGMLAPTDAARIQSEGDQATVTADGAAFISVADAVRADLARRAGEARDRAARDLRRAEAETDEGSAEALRAQSEQHAATAERLEALAGLQEGVLELDASTPSLLIEIAGGVILADSVAADGRSASGRIAMPLEDGVSQAGAGGWDALVIETPSERRRISDNQIIWARALIERGLVSQNFNGYLFLNADSREPELAGVKGAFFGTILTMFVTMALAVPIGVATAVYLEEFAPKNRLTDFIEVNINNLAAVPSIVFGLLGLAVFLNVFGLPRGVPLVGGMVLSLMTLPTVIISARAALKAVPPSVRQAALGVGASKTQSVFHHVLPLAAPGILTGSIIGLAQAMGETAPLLMIGMVAFIADAPPMAPEGLVTPSTVMPVQIFLWASAAERAFQVRAAAAIIILLVMMIGFNALAVYMRRRFERRW